MAEKFPQGVIVGELPPSCQPPQGRGGASRRAAAAAPVVGELTAGNLAQVRDQLEANLLADDGEHARV